MLPIILRGMAHHMRTRGELVFAQVVVTVGTVAGCAAVAWLAYWLLDNAGPVPFAIYCVAIMAGSLAIGITVDIRKRRYRFRDLPGALFRPAKH